ncbi:MAG: hypothetical protein HYT98_02445 [Candidatus Sungbacteria bacterium]|nr:hypothetical protein [Candidatus Sungbacteria bacterium]
MKNTWREFEYDEYTIIDLGRTATFLIPTLCLSAVLPNGRDVEDDLREYLTLNFGCFSESKISEFYVWMNKETILDYNRSSILFEVYLVNKDRVEPLRQKLSELARLLGEEFIYFGIGGHFCLIKPKLIS